MLMVVTLDPGDRAASMPLPSPLLTARSPPLAVSWCPPCVARPSAPRAKTPLRATSPPANPVYPHRGPPAPRGRGPPLPLYDEP